MRPVVQSLDEEGVSHSKNDTRTTWSEGTGQGETKITVEGRETCVYACTCTCYMLHVHVHVYTLYIQCIYIVYTMYVQCIHVLYIRENREEKRQGEE